MAEWSKLSFSSQEIPVHAEGCTVGWHPATGSYSSTFILSIQQEIFPPLFPIICMCSCPILVKSAVLPKTTIVFAGLSSLLVYEATEKKGCP